MAPTFILLLLLGSAYGRPWMISDLFSPFVDWSDNRNSNIFKINEDGLKIVHEITRYKPEELNVTVYPNAVSIMGSNYENKTEGDKITSSMYHTLDNWYRVSETVDLKKVTATFYSDSTLVIEAPSKDNSTKSNEKDISKDGQKVEIVVVDEPYKDEKNVDSETTEAVNTEAPTTFE